MIFSLFCLKVNPEFIISTFITFEEMSVVFIKYGMEQSAINTKEMEALT